MAPQLASLGRRSFNVRRIACVRFLDDHLKNPPSTRSVHKECAIYTPDRKREKMLAASDILSDIAPGKSANSREQTKAVATNGKRQIIGTGLLEPKMAEFVEVS
jgi:hypothetical protein